MSRDPLVEQAYQRADAAAELQRRLTEVHGTGASDESLVTAVVSGSGELVDLRIDPAALRLGPTALGEAIVEAAGHASADARQRGYTLMALAIGDEAAAEVERSDAPAPARALGWDTVTSGLVGADVPGSDDPTGPIPRATIDAALPAGSDDGDDVFTFDPSIFRSDR